MNLKPVRKLVAGVLAGLTSTGVVTFVHEVFNVNLDPGLAGLLVAAATTLAVYVSPPNEPGEVK